MRYVRDAAPNRRVTAHKGSDHTTANTKDASRDLASFYALLAAIGAGVYAHMTWTPGALAIILIALASLFVVNCILLANRWLVTLLSILFLGGLFAFVLICFLAGMSHAA